MKAYSTKRKIIISLAIGGLTFISLLLLGIIFIKYLPGLNLNDWLQRTANYWLIWRLGLYVLITLLIYQIHRYHPLPRKVLLLTTLALSFIEGLNLLYRL